jgi:hypothetical protein
MMKNKLKLALVAATALCLVVCSPLIADADVGAKSPREQWAAYKDKALPKMTRIQNDLTAVRDAPSKALPGLEESLQRLDCLTLEQHITADYKVLTHSPDKKLNTLLTVALSAWRDGAKACKRADFAKATPLYLRGNDYILRAADRIQVLTARYA